MNTIVVPFDKEKEVMESIRKFGMKDALDKFTAMGVPFMLAIAVADDTKKTKYHVEIMGPNAIRTPITDDKFVDFVNVINGFKTVMDNSRSLASSEALNMLDNEMLNAMDMYKDLDLVAITGHEFEVDELPDMKKKMAKPVKPPVKPLFTAGKEERLEYKMKKTPEIPKKNKEEYAKIDEIHKDILKGDGSFMDEMESVAEFLRSYNNITPAV